MALPTTSSDPTKTIVARKSFIRITPTAGVQADYLCKKISLNHAVNTLERKAVVNGLLMSDRVVPIERQVVFTCTFDEFPQALMDLVMGSSPKDGVAQIFISDPDDASGKAALMTNSFACRFDVDGGIDFDRENFSEMQIKIIATADVTYTIDGTA